jgi:hypothetical protein
VRNRLRAYRRTPLGNGLQGETSDGISYYPKSNRGSRYLAGALKTLNIARARAGAARAGWWQSRDPRQRGLIRFVFPPEASPASPKSAPQLLHSTRSFTAREEKWKTASRRPNRTSSPTAQHELDGLQPTAVPVLSLRPSHALGAAGRGLAWH